MSYSPYIEISLDNLAHNLGVIRGRLPAGVGVMAVVKDQAYGCGAIGVSRALASEGVAYLAVARCEEARALRGAGVGTPVLVLGECDIDDLRWGAANGLAFSLNSLCSLQRFDAAVVAMRLHVKFDTGMTRMGVAPEEVSAVAEFLRTHPAVTLEGACMHCASADVPGTPSVVRQLDIFGNALASLSSAGFTARHVHCANTATVLRFGAWRSTLVRPGISLYGCRPDPLQDFGVDLRPIASLKGQVVRLRRVPAGTAVSYGGTYVTPADTHVATVNIGYAHGLPRALGNCGVVVVRGQSYRIAGRVTMDYVMVDAGERPTMEPGDEAVAIGQSPGTTPDDVAGRCGTIAYEVLCGLSAALDRHYFRGGRLVEICPGCQY